MALVTQAACAGFKFLMNYLVIIVGYICRSARTNSTANIKIFLKYMFYDTFT